MIYQTLTMAFVAVALTLCGNATAQDCGSCGVAVVDYSVNHGGDPVSKRCGRSINQYEAALLWAGYCQEDCEYKGGGDCGACNDCGSRSCGGGCKLGGKLRGRMKNNDGCGCAVEMTTDCGGCNDNGCGGGCNMGEKLRGMFNKCGANDCGGRGGKLRGMFSGFGSRSGGCGCDMGCFGYPTDCGCGSDGGGFLSGGLLKSGCFGSKRAGRGCGNDCGDGCNLGGKLRDKFSGCGGKLRGMFDRSKNDCGCNGAYFNECVGSEYGTAGMQSCVSGCGAPVEMGTPSQVGMPNETDQPIGASDTPMELKSENAESAVEALKDDAAGN